MVQSSLGRWLQYLLTVVALFGLIYLFLVMIQPYRFSMVLAEKRGRVVDAQTGEGLPGVAVIVNYKMWSTTPMQAGGGCMQQKIVWTDAEGNYVVPSASEDIDVADNMLWRMVPGFSQSYSWTQLYYKGGYMEEGELQWRLRDMHKLSPSDVDKSLLNAQKGPTYIAPLIGMRKVDMVSSDSMADVYIAYTGLLAVRARCFLDEERNSEASRMLRNDMKISVRNLICDLPPDKVLAEEAERFSFNDCAASLGMKRILEKKGEGAVLTTGVMCEAYQYVPGEYECLGLKRKIHPLQLKPDIRKVRSNYPIDD